VESKKQEQRAEFEGRYSRCSNSLYFLAWGVLGNVAEAERALENCYRKASRELRRFSSDGEFGSWMIRMLLNEIVDVANSRKEEYREVSDEEYAEMRLIEAWAGNRRHPD
jgi:DNA-directed RNA polymerase specialized sigma24 family protein